MKKVVLIVLVGLFALSGEVAAQFSEGSLAATAGLALQTSKDKSYDGNTTTSGDPSVYFRLSPAVGYFLASDLEAGLRLGFANNTDKMGDAKRISKEFLFAPYVRKYITIGESVEFFGEGAITTTSASWKAKGDGSTESGKDYSSFSVGVSPGVVFMVSDKVGLEFKAGFFGYRSFKDFDSNDDKVYDSTSSFGLALDAQNIDFGIRVYLN